MADPRTSRRAFRDLWLHAGYRRMWTADVVSQLGTQVTFLALPLIAVLTLRAPAWQLGLLRGAEYVPAFLALRIGLIVDRRSRRTILIVADLAQAAILATLPVLNAAHVLTIGPLLGVALVLGTFWLAFDIAAQSFLPDVVDQRQLPDANVGLQLSNSIGQLAGPTLATLLIAAVSAPDAVLADMASFLVSAALLARVRTAVGSAKAERPTPGDPGTKGPARASDGARLVLGQPRLRALAATSGLTSVAVSITEALLVLFAVRDLLIPTALVGVIFTIGNVGILAGAAMASRLTRRLGLGRSCLIGVALEFLGLIILPFAPAGAVAVAAVGCSGLLSTTGIIVYNVGQVTLRQRAAPARLLGGVTAAARSVSLVGLLVGSVIGGGLGQLIGIRPALGAAAAIVAIAMLAASFSSLRQADPSPVGDPVPKHQEQKDEATSG